MPCVTVHVRAIRVYKAHTHCYSTVDRAASFGRLKSARSSECVARTSSLHCHYIIRFSLYVTSSGKSSPARIIDRASPRVSSRLQVRIIASPIISRQICALLTLARIKARGEMSKGLEQIAVRTDSTQGRNVPPL